MSIKFLVLVDKNHYGEGLWSKNLDTLGQLVSQVPGRTAVDMGTAAVAELARHPRIIGLKDVRST